MVGPGEGRAPRRRGGTPVTASRQGPFSSLDPSTPPEHPFQGCFSSCSIISPHQLSCSQEMGILGQCLWNIRRDKAVATQHCKPHCHQHEWVLTGSLPRVEGSLAKGVPLSQKFIFTVVIHLVLFHPARVVTRKTSALSLPGIFNDSGGDINVHSPWGWQRGVQGSKAQPSLTAPCAQNNLRWDKTPNQRTWGSSLGQKQQMKPVLVELSTCKLIWDSGTSMPCFFGVSAEECSSLSSFESRVSLSLSPISKGIFF